MNSKLNKKVNRKFSCFPRLTRKKGIIGSLITMFISTIAIVLILLIFIFGSGIVRKFSNVHAGVNIYDETRTGLDEVFNYMVSYQKFIEAKYLIAGGRDLDNALVEVGYEK